MRAIKEPVGIFYTLVDADGTTYDYYAFNNEKAAFHMAKNAKLLLDKILSDGD